MTFNTKRSLCILLFLCIATLGFSQSNTITAQFIGNCGLHMTDGTTDIYIDFPYKSGAHSYMEFDEAELDRIKENATFIFTHKHSDHYSKKNIKRVLKAKKGQTYGPWNIDALEQLSETLPEFDIKALKTEHKVFGISFKHYSYLITWHGKKLYLSGDTENADTIGTQENLDWAFVPFWILQDAKDKDLEIDAAMFYVYHLAAPQFPSAKENWDAVENIHPLTDSGERITIGY